MGHAAPVPISSAMSKKQITTSQGYVPKCLLTTMNVSLVSLQMPEEVIETVLEWLELQQQNRLSTGVWHTGVKGKL